MEGSSDTPEPPLASGNNCVVPQSKAVATKAAKSASPNKLPQHYDVLLHAHSAVDSVVCFLQRKHLRCSISSVLTLATGAFRQSVPDGAVTLSIIQQLLAVSPESFLVREIPRTADLPSVSSSSVSQWNPSAGEVAAPTDGGTGTGIGQQDKLAFVEILVQPAGGAAPKIAQRKSTFRAALVARVQAWQEAWLTQGQAENVATASEEGQGSSKGKSRKRKAASLSTSGTGPAMDPQTGWHASFPLETCPHIECAPLPGLLGASGDTPGQDAVGPVPSGARPSTPPQGAARTSAEAAAIRMMSSPSRAAAISASPGTRATTMAALINAGERAATCGPYASPPFSSAGPPVPSASSSAGLSSAPACTVPTLVDFLKAQPFYNGQIAYTRTFPGRPAQYGTLSSGLSLPAPVLAAMRARGITQLFSHQATAISAALQGRDVVLCTPTSSGKSLCFHAPVFTSLLRDPVSSVALYMFPTKALAQDQARGMGEFLQGSASSQLQEAVRYAVLDGDTPFDERETIRASANILLTNPDLLHATLLPQHGRWARLWAGLKYVVLDEGHVYRGVFGTHVAFVMRRLLRLCALYGSRPQFILCTATIANPAELFAALVPWLPPAEGGLQGSSRDVVIVGKDSDGSTVGTRTLIVWQPPLMAWASAGEKGEGSEAAQEDGQTLAQGKARPVSMASTAQVPSSSSSALLEPELLTPSHAADLSMLVANAAPRQLPAVVAAYAEIQTDRLNGKPEGSMSTSSATMSTAALSTDATGCPLVTPPAWFEDLLGNDMLSSGRKVALAKYLQKQGALPAGSASTASKISSVPNAHLDGDYVSRARGARGFEAATRAPGNYRKGAGSAPYGMAQTEIICADETASVHAHSQAHPSLLLSMPGWVQRWRERMMRVQAGQDADAEGSHRRSPIVETASILATFMTGGLRTIVFVKVRKVAELLLQYVQERLAALDNEWVAQSSRGGQGGGGGARTRPISLIAKVKSYRAGYLKSHRRSIERDLFSGNLLGVVATNALELGVDIGSLDVVLMLGYPGSTASLWQQAGRAGRGGKDSAAILVTYDSPVDQLLVRQPDLLLGKGPEAVHIDTGNPNILRMHLLCAAAEAPLCPWDLGLFGPAMGPVVSRLREEDKLLQADDYDDRAGGEGVGRALYRGISSNRGATQRPSAVQADATLASQPATTSQSSTSFTSIQYLPGHASGWVWAQDGQGIEAQVAVLEAEEELDRLIQGGQASALAAAALTSQASGSHSVGQSFASSSMAPSGCGSTAHGSAGGAGPGSAPQSEHVGVLHAWKVASYLEKSSSKISLRCIDEGSYSVVEIDSGREVDEVEERKAYWAVHEGAMYMNQGVTYKVVRMDTLAKVAYVRATSEQYYTSLQDHENINAQARSASTMGGHTHFGRAEVQLEAWGYRKIWKRTGQVFEFAELALPSISYDTFAIWTDVPLAVKRAMDACGLDYLGACHAAGHAVMACMPLFVLCDRADLGTECPAPMQRRARPLRFIVYDAIPGGVGISAAAFTTAVPLYHAALRLLETCPCTEGCPACCHDMACREFNYVIDKAGACVVLRAALGLPWGIPPQEAQG